jgi:hypothetical protein
MPNIGPPGMRVLQLNRWTAEYSNLHDAGISQIPSPDGSMVLTGNGPYSTPELKPVPFEKFRNILCVPTSDPGLFLGIQPPTGFRSVQPPPTVSVFSTEDYQLLFELPAIDELVRREMNTGQSLDLDNRVWLIPQANLLVALNQEGTVLVQRRIDVLDELERAGIDYFYVSSLPSREAGRGAAYRYAIRMNSRRPDVTFSLAAAPPGMTISPSGVLTWAVPANAVRFNTVVVAIHNSAGRELLHTFQIEAQ